MIRRLLLCIAAVVGGRAATEPSLEFGAEVLHAPGITLTQGTDTLRLVRGRSELALTLGLGSVAIDYAPVSFYFIGRAVERRATNV